MREIDPFASEFPPFYACLRPRWKRSLVRIYQTDAMEVADLTHGLGEDRYKSPLRWIWQGSILMLPVAQFYIVMAQLSLVTVFI